MIGRMAWLDCDERAAAGCGDLAMRDEFAFDDGAIV